MAHCYPVQWQEVNIIEEVEYALHIGIRAVPSVAINGQVVFTDLPTPSQLRQVIKSASE